MSIDRRLDVSFVIFNKFDKKACSIVRKHEKRRKNSQHDDCYIRGDWLGPSQILFYVSNLHVLTQALISDLQRMLKGYPRWEVVVIVCPPDEAANWPQMGMYIREEEIIDALQREYFPEEFQSLHFEGAIRGTAED